jgi:hypothetical protein
MASGMRRILLALPVVLLGLLGTAACGDDAPADGYRSVGTGDTYGEWELFAEWADGEWTGCLRFEPGGDEQCGDPAAPLATYDSGDGATFGAVAAGQSLLFEDGDEVELLDDRFFVVASDAEITLED